ncbi:MAG: hypothetical protein CM15mP21_1730 [Hyphomicrobiales bacterium]|nr:MAG: hypothetical protein CM15mP21_1730 [Hyphomicrobiales bacterium]
MASAKACVERSRSVSSSRSQNSAVHVFGEQETEQSGAGIADMQQSVGLGAKRVRMDIWGDLLISVSASTRLETRW